MDDPAGTPTNKKISIQNFFSNVEPQITFANVTEASNSTAASVKFSGGVGVSKNMIIDGNVTVNGVFTMTGNGSVSNLTSNISPGVSITYDVGNTTSSWKDAYIQSLKGHNGALAISANTTASANLTVTGANVFINGTQLTVDSNASYTANLTTTTDSALAQLNSVNTHITSNTTVAGTNTVISSNTTINGANATIAGTNAHITSNTTLNGTNTVIASNATLSGANTNITGTNAHITSNSTIAGTNTDISSNTTLTGANLNITGTNTNITSNVTITAQDLTVGPNASFSANVSIAGNATLTTDSSLIFRDSELRISSATDGELTINADSKLILDTGSLNVSSNSTLAGTNANVTANLFVTGANTRVTSANITFDSANFTVNTGNFISNSNVSFTSDNTSITGDNTAISSNVTISGTDMTVSANVSASANVRITSAIDSTTNTTGALTVTGGVGVAKKLTVGENLLVHGNIHANGNITADGNLTLGSDDTDSVSFGADLASSIIPTTDSTYDLGNTTHRFANAYIDDIAATSNVTVGAELTVTANTTLSENTQIATDKSLIFRDSAIRISSAEDGNMTVNADANVTIDSADIRMLGGDITIASNTTSSANVRLTSAIDSTTNTTGALTVTGGVGVAKKVTIGENLLVHGNIHANGNITADGNLTLGSDDTDSVSFGADLASDIIPTTDGAHDLGNTTHRFANAYIDDLAVTSNTVSARLESTSNASLPSLETTNTTVSVTSNTTFTGNVTIGADDSGHDFKVFTATSGKHVTIDESLDLLTVNVEARFQDTLTSNGTFDLSEAGILSFGRNLKVLTDANTTTQTYVVTVKSHAGGNRFFFDGKNPTSFAFIEGGTYRFDVSDNSVAGHPLAFSSTDPASSTTAYTTGVTTSGTAGSADAYVEITPAVGQSAALASGAADGIPRIYPYCTSHGNMALSSFATIDAENEGDLQFEDATGEAGDKLLTQDASRDRLTSNSTGFIYAGNFIGNNFNISDGSGTLNLGTRDDLASGVVRISNAYNLPNTAGANGTFLKLQDGNLVFATGTGINMTDLVDDTSPQLGGALDLNTNQITDEGQANTVISARASDGLVIIGDDQTSTFFCHRISNGRHGINTTTPDASLQINGTLNVSSAVAFSGNFDIAGHNLTDTGLKLAGTLVTSSAAELNILDGVTSTATELNTLDGVSATLSAADLSAVENFEETVSATTSAVTITSGKDFDIAGHDLIDNGLKLGGTLVTASAAEINKLDGVTATTAELNYAVVSSLGTVVPERFLHTDSNKTISFTGLGGADTHNGQMTIGNVICTDTTTSTSNSSGSLRTAGGFAVKKNAYIGQRLVVQGNTTFSANATFSGTVSGNSMDFDKVADTFNMKIRAVGIGTTTLGSSDIGATANNILVIGNGVAPTSFPADQAYLYAKDDGGQSHIYTCDEGGTSTRLGAHNPEGEWEFYSYNRKTGKTVRINMERMIKKLEEFTGETFIENE